MSWASGFWEAVGAKFLSEMSGTNEEITGNLVWILKSKLLGRILEPMCRGKQCQKQSRGGRAGPSVLKREEGRIKGKIPK